MKPKNEQHTGQRLDLTRRLPLGARLGRTTSIIDWLAAEGRERQRMTVVWINRRRRLPRARACTSNSAEHVAFAPDLIDLLEDPSARVELWHSAPAGPNTPSIPWPGPEGIATTTMPGTAAVSTVDDWGGTRRITPADPRPEHRVDVIRWATTAAILARREHTIGPGDSRLLRRATQGERSDLLDRPDYSEEDVRQLESQDFADPTVVSALLFAYERLDPEQRDLVGLRTSPIGHSVGSETELEERLAEANTALADTPTRYQPRVRRLMALLGLALAAEARETPAPHGRHP